MNKKLILILLLLVGLIGTSCNALRSSSALDESIIFSIDDISAIGQANDVSIGGQATLPDGTKLAISAVRPLEDLSADMQSEQYPVYSILDRQFVTVQDGRWQTNLTLKKSDGSGTAFEAWQSEVAPLSDAINPSSKVSFLLALEPKEFSSGIRDDLSNVSINNGLTKVSYTQDGEAYIQVAKLVSIQTPSGFSVAEKSSPTEYLQAWKARSQYNPPVNEESQAANIPFSDNDNLVLPAANMLQ